MKWQASDEIKEKWRKEREREREMQRLSFSLLARGD